MRKLMLSINCYSVQLLESICEFQSQKGIFTSDKGVNFEVGGYKQYVNDQNEGGGGVSI